MRAQIVKRSTLQPFQKRVFASFVHLCSPAMADSLSSLLSNQLATNEQVLLATPLDFTIKVVTTLQLVQGAERQEGVDGPTLHR